MSRFHLSQNHGRISFDESYHSVSILLFSSWRGRVLVLVGAPLRGAAFRRLGPILIAKGADRRPGSQRIVTC